MHYSAVDSTVLLW